jgi:hypothetical protein
MTVDGRERGMKVRQYLGSEKREVTDFDGNEER